jgi:glycosyltransferase involved in cell wall biosynthesis
VTAAPVRVAILATHPVQYYVPWYRRLAEAVDLEVLYCHRQTAEGQGRAGFGVRFDWDVPLFGGYRCRFLRNVASRPDVDRFGGCDTPEVARVVEAARFDAFILQGWATRSAWQAMRACRRRGTPILIRGDSQLRTRRPWPWRALKWILYRRFIPRFDAYLVVGARAREYLLHYGARPERMFFAPHAVDNEFFASGADGLRAQRTELRRAWGLPPDATVFLFAGKLVPRKRPEDFLQAIAAAAARDPGVWGLVAGDGPLRGALEGRASAGRCPVRFSGFLNQTEIPRAYAAADALVLPSDARETWGLVVNEAMASGLPVIVSDAVGCAPDLVRPGETGVTFRCGALGELRDALLGLAADPARRATLGAGARRHVRRYSVAAATEGTLRAIEAVRHAPLPIEPRPPAARPGAPVAARVVPRG